jgi:hypothetical protein
MITCPMCKKKLRGMEKECLSCKADVSLLVDYVGNLREGLTRAEALTRAGQLGEAVWAYLEVLEIDPDNATARKQIGQVATAVRQFDETAPGRRWLTKLHKRKRFQRWMATLNENGEAGTWWGTALFFLVVLGALLVGFMIGSQHTPPPPGEQPVQTQPADKDDKKPADVKKPADDSRPGPSIIPFADPSALGVGEVFMMAISTLRTIAMR